MKVCVVIPAYNEGKKIAEVISQVFKLYKNVIVVNDGSTDNTRDVLKQFKDIIVCSHIINRGQGAALRTGTLLALELGADIIVHFDADGQMKAEDIKKLTNYIESGEYDVVLGSRFLDGKSNIPAFRKFILKLARIFNTYILRIHSNLTDPQSGFRALSRRAAQSIEITQDRMAHCSEILQEIQKNKLTVKEVPVTIEYTDYSLAKGQKTSNAFQIVWSLLLGKFIK